MALRSAAWGLGLGRFGFRLVRLHNRVRRFEIGLAGMLRLVAVVVIAVLTYVNCRGLESGKWVQNVFTVAKTLGRAFDSIETTFGSTDVTTGRTAAPLLAGRIEPPSELAKVGVYVPPEAPIAPTSVRL